MDSHETWRDPGSGIYFSIPGRRRWGVVHKQAYGSYRTLQEPSDCFPFQSAHVLSADVLLRFPTLLEGISGLLKIPLLPNLS